jgi:hypothetical protein
MSSAEARASGQPWKDGADDDDSGQQSLGCHCASPTNSFAISRSTGA